MDISIIFAETKVKRRVTQDYVVTPFQTEKLRTMEVFSTPFNFWK